VISKRSDTYVHADDLIKNLLGQRRHLLDFFRAFLPETLKFADFTNMEYLDKEHSKSGRKPRRTGDLLVKARWKGQDAAFMIHLESQHKAQHHIVERAAEYALRDSIRYGLPVMPVVLLTYAKPETTPESTVRWEFGSLAKIEVKCPIVHFRRLKPARYLGSKNVAALTLSALMKLNPEEQVDIVVETVAESILQGMSEAEMEAALEFLHGHNPLEEAQFLQLDEKVRRLAEKDKRLALMPKLKLINPFEEITKLKARQEGREEGEITMVMKLLTRRFPDLVEGLRPKIRKLDEEGLLSFGEALMFIQDEKACMAWFKGRK
jgi:hypothetical protein